MSESVARAEVEIVNKLGLHARAAAKFVTTAARYRAEVLVRRAGREINGKSIMGVMMLAAGKGARVEIETRGEDAAEVLADLVALIADRFGEEQ